MQKHGDRYVWINPPAIPFLPKRWTAFLRCRTSACRIRLWQCSYSGLRNDPFLGQHYGGCFGGCSFCSITEHEGRIIRAVRKIRSSMRSKRSATPFQFYGRNFRSRWANCQHVYVARKSPRAEQTCRRLSCVYPDIVRIWTLTTNRRSTSIAVRVIERH